MLFLDYESVELDRPFMLLGKYILVRTWQRTGWSKSRQREGNICFLTVFQGFPVSWELWLKILNQRYLSKTRSILVEQLKAWLQKSNLVMIAQTFYGHLCFFRKNSNYYREPQPMIDSLYLVAEMSCLELTAMSTSTFPERG